MKLFKVTPWRYKKDEQNVTRREEAYPFWIHCKDSYRVKRILQIKFGPKVGLDIEEVGL